MLGWSSFEFIQEILYEPSPNWDEDVSLREKRNRFVGASTKFCKGEVDIDGWKPMF